ncbi:MAG: iron-containing alcohol dehydrogenase [Pseudomonadota bacterium]
MTELVGDWNFPTLIRFGAGRISELPEVLAMFGLKRPLLVTDEGLAGLPMLTDIVDGLSSAAVDVQLYSNVQGNPTLANVLDGVALYHRTDRDSVIALGGGSALDAGKTIAFLTGQSGTLWDYVDGDDAWMRANPDGVAPVLAVPTTAGTGSEVGRAAVILDEQANRKRVVWHPRMMASLVISDPELSIGLPANLTAWTGIDALVHAVEAYTSPVFHPMAEGIAIQGIRTVARWLPTAVADGTNIDARANMLVAASMGATAFQKGLGSVHAISHSVGALYNTHHGLTNAVVLPYGLEQNLPACAEKLEQLARILALPSETAMGFIDYIYGLRERLDIPNTLAEIGVPDECAGDIARMSLEDPTAETNAMPLSVGEYEALFLRSQSGS